MSEWIASLKLGDLDSIQKLWDRYKVQLLEFAHQRLLATSHRADDEHDISQSVLIDIWRGAKDGRFEDVRNRDDLWWTLLKITKCKVIDSIRYHGASKRGGREGYAGVLLATDLDAQGVSTFEGLIGGPITSETIVILEEQATVLLQRLRNPALRKIAEARIEGYTVAEIAQMMAVPQRSVERKLKLIRDTWSGEFERVSA